MSVDARDGKPDLSSRREGGVWDVYIQVSELESLWDRVSSVPGYVLVFAEQTSGGEP